MNDSLSKTKAVGTIENILERKLTFCNANHMKLVALIEGANLKVSSLTIRCWSCLAIDLGSVLTDLRGMESLPWSASPNLPGEGGNGATGVDFFPL